MGLRINNLLSLKANNQLQRTQKAIARSLERLSSGQRINSARDDIAGLTIASRLEAQRRGLLQGVRNINDSLGIIETADSALAEQSSIVLRIRELAVQASNGTLSDSDRTNLDAEAQALMAEFTRLTSQTQFNGRNLIDGSFSPLNIQVGSQTGQTISLTIDSLQASQVFTTSTTIPATAAVGTGTFKVRSTISLGSSANWITSSDLNGDGFIDLMTTDAGGTASIALGNGNGTFTARTTIATGSYPTSLVTGDTNGDGFVDIMISDDSSATVSIALGNGNGTFKARSTIATGSGPNNLIAIDTNGDGFLDIITGDYTAGTASIALGNGNGTFVARTTVTTGTQPYSVFAVDTNGDGKIDLMSADSGSSTVSIFLGNGNGTFATRTTTATGTSPRSVKAVDTNGDGFVDLVTADLTTKTLSIALGNGNGTFKARTTVAVGTTDYVVIARDLNGDGYLDLVTNDTGNATLSILIGNGNGTFQTRTTVATGTNPYGVTSADVNGDGIIDLMDPDNTNNTVSIFLGNSTPGTSAYTTTGAATISLRSQSSAEDALTYLDTGIAYINAARANIAAIHSRLDFAASFNQTTVENISEARSKIVDTDYAIETANLVRLQILQEAGIAVLAQANLNSQLALKLFEKL